VAEAGIAEDDELVIELEIRIILQELSGPKHPAAIASDQTIAELRQIAADKLVAAGNQVTQFHLILIKDGRNLEDQRLPD
jgi:hypothetical protein